MILVNKCVWMFNPNIITSIKMQYVNGSFCDQTPKFLSRFERSRGQLNNLSQQLYMFLFKFEGNSTWVVSREKVRTYSSELIRIKNVEIKSVFNCKKYGIGSPF